MWLLAAGLVPAATLFYGLGVAQPDPNRWLSFSAIVSLGLLWLVFRKQ